MEFYAKVGIKFGMCKICKSAASCSFVAAVAEVATTTNFNASFCVSSFNPSAAYI